MIQLNLLPDVKIEFMKLRRLERLVISIAIVIVGASVVVLAILISLVYGVQKNNLHNLNKNITTYESKIVSTPNLNKILTIQNQLAVLPSLDQQKPVVTRLFGYIQQLTPDAVTISTLQMNFAQNSIQVSGNASNLAAINQYVDIFKFAKYTTSSNSPSLNVFSSVVLTNFGLSNGQASYEINANYAPAIFSSNYSNVQINVPAITSTRSVYQLPLFYKQPSSSNSSSSQS
jgi:hypothetical protein